MTNLIGFDSQAYPIAGRKVATCGIGYGQKGFWGNDHYASLEAGHAAFERKLADLRSIYGKPGRNWTGQFVEQATESPHIIRCVRFIPLKKNGKPGRRVHTVTFYAIPETQARRFLERDLFYSVKDWQH